jgi:tetrahydrodipicolinate N-succinyltransferase
MVVFNIYFARSNIGTVVGVGVIVAVGSGVTVEVGMVVVVGVCVGGEKGIGDEQDEMNERRKMKSRMMEEAVLFRMGCILPRVSFSLKTKPSHWEVCGRVCCKGGDYPSIAFL